MHFFCNSERGAVFLENILFIVCFRYTKPKGQLPDYTAPVVLKGGRNSVEDFCNKLHRSIIKEFKW